MNKVIQVNLGGIAFTFDDDAYDTLDDYLASLDGYFKKSAGHGEIMHDIEARLAELFTSNLKGRSIVTEDDVKSAISVLGTPEDFGVDQDQEEQYASSGQRASQSSAKDYGRSYSRYGKKLMRDPDDSQIGGVCSGLAAYLGVEDPMWIRVAFVASVIFAGVGILPYIILWIVMPVAKTAGDKLAMRGEPIDVDSISRQVETEARNIGDKITEWSEEISKTDWSEKFSSKKSRANKGRKKSEKDEGFMV